MSTLRNLSKFQINRRAAKQPDIDNRVRVPKDMNERCWSEVQQKEETDLLLFDLREEIVDEAINIYYEKYMQKQCTLFTVHCAAEAFLQIIDWHFYCHDPGVANNKPAAYIPHRAESWKPDEPPEPSPKDTMAKENIEILEEVYKDDATLARKWPSNSSIDYPVIEEIPEEYWFPGRVELPGLEKDQVEEESVVVSTTTPHATSSELLERVTDYSTGTGPKASAKSSRGSIRGIEFSPSLQGGGDSLNSNQEVGRVVQVQTTPARRASVKTRRSQMLQASLALDSSIVRSRISKMSNRFLSPLDIHAEPISDCRLRTLRVVTQFEVSSEVVETEMRLTTTT